MNHRIAAEAIEQAENVVHCELSVAPVHQLNGASILQIDAWNQHVR